MNFYDSMDLYDSMNEEKRQNEENEENDEIEYTTKSKKSKKKKSKMSWKSILFFIVLFGILIFGYFSYDTFTQYIPINWIFRIIFLIGGLLAVLFPVVMTKIKAGYSTDELKRYMIKKYSSRPHYYQDLNKTVL